MKALSALYSPLYNRTLDPMKNVSMVSLIINHSFLLLMILPNFFILFILIFTILVLKLMFSHMQKNSVNILNCWKKVWCFLWWPVMLHVFYCKSVPHDQWSKQKTKCTSRWTFRQEKLILIDWKGSLKVLQGSLWAIIKFYALTNIRLNRYLLEASTYHYVGIKIIVMK